MRRMIDVGEGHSIEFIEYKGEISGLHLNHPGCPSPAFITFTDRSWAKEFNGQIETWEVIQDSPLTLSPSILCRCCKDHGFIIEGKWVKA